MNLNVGMAETLHRQSEMAGDRDKKIRDVLVASSNGTSFVDITLGKGDLGKFRCCAVRAAVSLPAQTCVNDTAAAYQASDRAADPGQFVRCVRCMSLERHEQER